MGWQGARQGLSLEESCPTDPKEYYNPKYFRQFN